MMDAYQKKRKAHRRKAGEGSLGGTPGEVVSMCEQFSSDLKNKPLSVKLHTGVGSIAEGTVGLELNADGVAELIVKARGSHLFGLVRKEHRHAFTPGDLEKSGTHTAFLRRSIRAIVKGDEAARDEMLGRSLSLIHKREAVDITFESKAARDQLNDWIDAKWSVSMIQKSFRRDARTTLALQGKRQTLNEQAFYDAIGPEGLEETKEERRLPRLEPDKLDKLQDDLLNGIHVTYHDKAFQGINTRSRPCRLRHDYLSKDGLIILEPSFTDGGPTITRPISELIQVGGGPSASGLTSLLLRVTSDHVKARACAVSLVFEDISMDITCASEKDATEIVLFFSEIKGFTRAAPPPPAVSPLPVRSIIPSEQIPGRGTVSNPAAAPAPARPLLPPTTTAEQQQHSQDKHARARAMEDLFRSETGERDGDHVDEDPVVQAAVFDLSRTSHHRLPPDARAMGASAPPLLVSPSRGKGTSAALATAATSAGKQAERNGSAEDEVSALRSDWSSRFKLGIPGDGDKDALKRQMSAVSGFGGVPPVSSDPPGFEALRSKGPRDDGGQAAAVMTGKLVEQNLQLPDLVRQSSAASAASSFHQGLVEPPRGPTDELGREVIVKKSTVFHTSHVPITMTAKTVANACSPRNSAAAATTQAPMFHTVSAVASGAPVRWKAKDGLSDSKPSPRRRTIDPVSATDRRQHHHHFEAAAPAHADRRSMGHEASAVSARSKLPSTKPAAGPTGGLESDAATRQISGDSSSKARKPPERRKSDVPGNHVHLFQTAPHATPYNAEFARSIDNMNRVRSGRRGGRGLGGVTRDTPRADLPAGDDTIEGTTGRNAGRPTSLRPVGLKQAIPEERNGSGRTRAKPSRDRGGSPQEKRAEQPRHGNDRHRQQQHYHQYREHPRMDAGSVHRSAGNDSSPITRRKPHVVDKTVEPFTSPAAVALSRAEAEAAARHGRIPSPFFKTGNSGIHGGRPEYQLKSLDRAGGRGGGERGTGLRSLSPTCRGEHRIGRGVEGGNTERDDDLGSRHTRASSDTRDGRTKSHQPVGEMEANWLRSSRSKPLDAPITSAFATGSGVPPRPISRSPTCSEASGSVNGSGSGSSSSSSSGNGGRDGGRDMDRNGKSCSSPSGKKRPSSLRVGNFINSLASRSGVGHIRGQHRSPSPVNALRSPHRGGAANCGSPNRRLKISGLFSSNYHRSTTANDAAVDDFGDAFQSVPSGGCVGGRNGGSGSTVRAGRAGVRRQFATGPSHTAAGVREFSTSTPR